MEKVEQFIREHTRNCSNEMESPLYANPKLNFYPWLAPKDARMVAQMAREEIYEWLQEHSQEYVYWMDEEFGKDDLINDLKQAMKDET